MTVHKVLQKQHDYLRLVMSAGNLAVVLQRASCHSLNLLSQIGCQLLTAEPELIFRQHN